MGLPVLPFFNFCLRVTEEAPKEAPPEHSSAEKPFGNPPENITTTPNEEPKTPEGDHFVHQLFNMLFSLADYPCHPSPCHVGAQTYNEHPDPTNKHKQPYKDY